MGAFDEYLEKLEAAENDDVTWLEGTLRLSVEPSDWPYWGVRLIKRIRAHEELMRELVDARAQAARLRWFEQEEIMAPAFAKLRRTVPADVQTGGGDELAADVAEMKAALERDEIDAESLRTARVDAGDGEEEE